jgi:transcriptional regulator of acetoin/glycerol metabolism
MDALGRAVLESLDQGIAVFDVEGRLVYANPSARRLIAESNGAGRNARALLATRGRAVMLLDGEAALGEAVFLGADGSVNTLAEREREAIQEALSATGGRLAEAARRLGISRTTLWRRLRAYGAVHHPGVPS